MKKVLVLLLILSISLVGIFANGSAEKTSSATTSTAISWPNQAINIVVAFGAGGASDYNTRALAKYLTTELGQPVVVTNVGGSGGTIGASQVKNAKADGYTILCSQISMNIAQAIGMVDYGYEAFEMGPVFSRSADEVLTVRSDSGWNTFDDMIKDTKANPGKYRLTANTGASTMWIAVALQNAGAKFNIVSSGGSGERLQLLLGGHVDVIPMPLNMVQDYVDKGTFRLLATDSPNRGAKIPDVPTLKEKNVDCAYYYNNTFFFPKGTDKAIIDKFSAACKKIIETNEDYRKEVYGFSQDPVYMSPEEASASYKSELASLMAIKDQLKGTK
ncbi:MAG: tripartite tricarboxylate transporter substrate binding protein [Sphaerochaetaceae bacterium]